MTTGRYKKWTKQEREFSYALVKKAEALGWIKPRVCCERCTQDKGIIHLHCEDYDVTTRVLSEVFKRDPVTITDQEKAEVNAALEVLCWRCHMIHHSSYRAPQACETYWAAVKGGKVFPPVFKHDFTILKVDNGIY